MSKLHVLLKKEDLDRERLPGKTVIVLDVLFATSSIVTVLANGATEVLPLLDGAAAREEAGRRAPGSFVLAGELDAVTLEGFCHPTPLALLREPVAGRPLIYCTTNGTVALAKAREAEHVYAAALLNGSAVVEHVERTHRARAGGGQPPGERRKEDVEDGAEDTVLVVCSGSADRFNLEDFYGAGFLVSRFIAGGAGRWELSDSARAALLLHDRVGAYECLAESRVGQFMVERGWLEELAFAARKDLYDVVPVLEGGRLRSLRSA
jgi:2-phosphosulfolactate phosphatase